MRAPKGPLEALSRVWKCANDDGEREYQAHFNCPSAEVVAKREVPFKTVARIDMTVLMPKYECHVSSGWFLKRSTRTRMAIRQAPESMRAPYSTIQESWIHLKRVERVWNLGGLDRFAGSGGVGTRSVLLASCRAGVWVLIQDTKAIEVAASFQKKSF